MVFNDMGREAHSTNNLVVNGGRATVRTQRSPYHPAALATWNTEFPGTQHAINLIRTARGYAK